VKDTGSRLNINELLLGQSFLEGSVAEDAGYPGIYIEFG
jgi:hypothetical protein